MAHDDVSEQILAARRMLVTMVAHELRGPLAGAQGLVELLAGSEDGDLPPLLRRDMAHDAFAAIARVGAVIEDVLLCVHGPSRLEIGDVPLAAALLEGLGPGDADAAELGLALGDAPPVRGDRAGVARALAELVANGRAPSGGRDRPTVSWRATGAEVIVDVLDRGPRILVEERVAAVNRLDRAPGGLRSHRNPSLGVQVARVLAEAMGGGVEVDDGAGGGCVFRLRLPRA